jgi:2,3-bisphosphoglycerate-independent phosphoglycerate mutase
MDGYGLAPAGPGNAVRSARTPNLDRLIGSSAHSTLSASGLDVGLPPGQIGNSEVGHMNLGAGRLVYQDLPRISRSIEDGTFFENPAFRAAMDACLEKGTSLHLMGLLSDGGVHSHIGHLWALLELAARKGLRKVYVHAFLDGRDVSPTSGQGFVERVRGPVRGHRAGKIATVMGRYYGMDRDKRWERVKKAYDAMVCGEAPFEPDPEARVAKSYAAGVTDEFMEPVSATGKGQSLRKTP